MPGSRRVERRSLPPLNDPYFESLPPIQGIESAHGLTQRQWVKRVCMVSQGFEGRDLTGGIQRYMRAVDLEILRHHNVTIDHVYMTQDPKSEERGARVGRGSIVLHPVYQGEGVLNYFSPIALTNLSRLMRGMLSTGDVDVVHIHSPYTPMGNICSKLAKEYDVPSVVTQHMIGRRMDWGKEAVGKILLSTTSRRAALKLGVSMESCRMLGSGAVYIGSGVDTEFFKPEHVDEKRFFDKHPMLEDKEMLLLAGRFTPIKGQLELLKAFDGLPDEMKDRFSIVYAGTIVDEKYRGKVEAYAKETGLSDKIHILGQISDPRLMLDLYGLSVLPVVPSLEEATPLVIQEAAAMHKGVLATRVGDIPREVVAGVTGKLVAPGDINGLRDGLVEMLSDPEGLKLMGDASRKRIERYYSIQRLSDETFLYYNWLACKQQQGIQVRMR